MAIILDIETIAIDGAGALSEPVSAPANYKDPVKIAAYIEEAQKAQTDKAALYPWTARVAALGWIDNDGRETVMLGQDEHYEALAIRAFWASVYHDDNRFVQPIIGYNHRAFDLPVLLARSILLGIEAPALNLDRYRTPHIDLMDRLTWHGVVQARSLKWFAKRFGLPVDDEVGGKDIAGLVASGDWALVESHCLSDIRLTKALAERLGVVRGGRVAA
jgi:hypothetical protein